MMVADFWDWAGQQPGTYEIPDDKNPYVDIVFDGPPGHDGGRFVEVEDAAGRGISLGKWVERPDGLWALRIRAALVAGKEVEHANHEES